MYEKNELISELKIFGAFWSYDSEKLQKIPNSVLIEECLRYGDVQHILYLLKLFKTDIIVKVWEEKLIPDERIYSHNYYLACIFFNINSPKKYIEKIKKQNNRYDRIKKFDAGNRNIKSA